MVVPARLVVCRSAQGQGICRALLADAIERVLMASEEIARLGRQISPWSAHRDDPRLRPLSPRPRPLPGALGRPAPGRQGLRPWRRL